MKINRLMVNWAYEDEQCLEYYEWDEDDPIEWIFKTELFCVSKECMMDIEESLLVFQNLNKGYYVFSDGSRCVVIAVDSVGHLCMRSYLSYNDQRLVKGLVKDLEITLFNYEVMDRQQPKEYGLTRFEKEKKQLLLAYLDLFDHEEISELASHNWDYIENGYHLFHEYLYFQISRQKRKT